MHVTIVLFLLHANITRYFYFLVTMGNLAVVNSIRADESSQLVPTRCLLFLVTNGNSTLLFFICMGVNSIRAYKLSAIVRQSPPPPGEGLRDW